MTLKSTVGTKIMNEVIKGTGPANIELLSKRQLARGYRILIVDRLPMRIISACCQMQDIAYERVTLVERIDKRREPFPSLDAVYFITPTKECVEALIKDFEPVLNATYRGASFHGAMYRNAHVFFTDTCPEGLFDDLCKSKCSRRIKTLKEINIAFLPYENQVFSLDSPQSFQVYYNPRLGDQRLAKMERMAEQIATVCATLGEYPSVRYRGDFELNVQLAQMVQQKLDAYKAEDPTMGEGREKARTQLLILDRGFDCVSPLLHELTFQAMAYDLLEIKNDVVTFGGHGPASPPKEVLLDENDELWVELRHQHIAVVSQNVTSNLKHFIDSKRMATDTTSIKDLGQMIKRMPQYQQELSKYSKHLQLAEECLTVYQDHVHLLCRVEQDLAMGTSADGEKIKDHMLSVVPILLDNAKGITDFEKLRIILLYILQKDGVTQEKLGKLFQHGNIPGDLHPIVTNLALLGANVTFESKKKSYQFPRKDRHGQHQYDMSRWTPIVKDILEDVIEDKLDQKHFPFWTGRNPTSGFPRPGPSTNPTSARLGNPLHRDKGQQPVKKLPRLIVFIVGGVTYSEMRTAYEVSAASKSWEFIIGSTHILIPDEFLINLKNLSEYQSL